MVKIKGNKSSSPLFPSDKASKEKLKLFFDNFLRQIKANIDKIKVTKKKKYSLLSCIFLCFYQKKKNVLDKKEIADFILKEIKINKNKIVIPYVKKKDYLVTQKNYHQKLYHILKTSNYFIKVINVESDSEDQIKLNEEYIISHKKSIYIKLFGRNSSDKKPKRKTKKRKRVRAKRRKFKKCLIARKNDKIDEDKRDNNEKQNKILFNVIKGKNNEKIKEMPFFNPINENEKEAKKIKFFTTKSEILDLENKKVNYLIKKRKNIFVTIKPETSYEPKHNFLIMPKFADNSYDIKINIKKEKEDEISLNEKNYTNRRYEIVSTSNKEISYINNLANQFILHLKSPRLVNAIKNGDHYIRVNGQILLNYEDDPIISNLLKAIMREYLNFCEYMEYFMGNKNDLSDDDNNDIFSSNKENHIIDKFKTAKKKCLFIINKIITRLTQFITEYDFITKVIKDLWDCNHNLNSLKELLNLINNNENILCKENIFHFEKILNIEFDNASNFFMVKYGIINKI